MSREHRTVVDAILGTIQPDLRRIHERIDDTHREMGDIKGDIGEVRGKVDVLAVQVSANGVTAREAGERLARLEGGGDDKTGTATVAMRAIGAVESKPWLMIGFVTMFAIAAAAWVLTR